MNLYLVRHGMAKSKEDDPHRGLTDEGVNNIEKLGQYIAQLELKFEGIYHSDKERAVQTAAILAKHIRPELGVHETDHLGPKDDIEVWIMRALCSEGDPVLVGHLPHLNKLASKLIAEDDSKQLINFTCGSMVCLTQQEDDKFCVKWMLAADSLI